MTINYNAHTEYRRVRVYSIPTRVIGLSVVTARHKKIKKYVTFVNNEAGGLPGGTKRVITTADTTDSFGISFRPKSRVRNIVSRP